MKRFSISRDDRYHEGWPNICLAPNGNLVCSYAEADVHGGGSVSSAVVRISQDKGHTWSEPIIVDTLFAKVRGFMMCRAVICLQDGSLMLGADWVNGNFTRPPGAPHNWGNDPDSSTHGQVWLYRSFDNGLTWTGPEKTGCLATSLNLKQTSDGAIFISASHFHCQGQYWSQMVYRSTDNGKSWAGPIKVLDDPKWNFAEGDLVELSTGELVMYIRGFPGEGSSVTGVKAISYDSGFTWEGPFAAGKWPIVGSVSVGRLSSGEVLVMHRVGGFALQEQFGFFIELPETALEKIPCDNVERLTLPAGLHWGIIDNDTSQYADHGYGGWVELPSRDVYAVNYIVDNAPKDRPQIRGYCISRQELHNPTRDLIIDFEAPVFKRGKLDTQQGWVRQKPEFWFTRGLAPGTLGNLGNYVMVDQSGEHCYTGKAGITGSGNENGAEEVLRRDVGPYDLFQEDVQVSLIHSGRQEFGMFRISDAAGQTIVELRADFVHDRLWAQYGRGNYSVSDVDCSQGWWHTKLFFTKDMVKIYTCKAGQCSFKEPWSTFNLIDSGEYKITNEVNRDLICTGKLERKIASIVVALGSRGAFYIDRIEIQALPRA